MSYREARKEIAKQVENTLACRVCGTPATAKTLSDFGAMCYGCYSDYCKAIEPSQAAPFNPQVLRNLRIGLGDPKAWAKILKAREEGGERLSALQSKAWHEALKEAA